MHGCEAYESFEQGRRAPRGQHVAGVRSPHVVEDALQEGRVRAGTDEWHRQQRIAARMDDEVGQPWLALDTEHVGIDQLAYL